MRNNPFRGITDERTDDMRLVNIFRKAAQTWDELVKRRVLDSTGETASAVRMGASFMHADYTLNTYGIYTTGFQDLVKQRDS